MLRERAVYTGGRSAAPRSPKSTAVEASTSGYCSEMREPHERHLPRSMSHETTGTRSCHRSCAAQERQPLRPARDRAPRRMITTLRKLPIRAPNRPKTRAVSILTSIPREIIAVFPLRQELPSISWKHAKSAPTGALFEARVMLRISGRNTRRPSLPRYTCRCRVR